MGRLYVRLQDVLCVVRGQVGVWMSKQRWLKPWRGWSLLFIDLKICQADIELAL